MTTAIRTEEQAAAEQALRTRLGDTQAGRVIDTLTRSIDNSSTEFGANFQRAKRGLIEEGKRLAYLQYARDNGFNIELPDEVRAEIMRRNAANPEQGNEILRRLDAEATTQATAQFGQLRSHLLTEATTAAANPRTTPMFNPERPDELMSIVSAFTSGNYFAAIQNIVTRTPWFGKRMEAAAKYFSDRERYGSFSNALAEVEQGQALASAAAAISDGDNAQQARLLRGFNGELGRINTAAAREARERAAAAAVTAGAPAGEVQVAAGAPATEPQVTASILPPQVRAAAERAMAPQPQAPSVDNAVASLPTGTEVVPTPRSAPVQVTPPTGPVLS